MDVWRVRGGGVFSLLLPQVEGFDGGKQYEQGVFTSSMVLGRWSLPASSAINCKICLTTKRNPACRFQPSIRLIGFRCVDRPSIHPLPDISMGLREASPGEREYLSRAHARRDREFRYKPLPLIQHGKADLHLPHSHDAAHRLCRFLWGKKQKRRISHDKALGRSHIENLLYVPPKVILLVM